MLLPFPKTDVEVPATETARPSVWLVMDLEAKKRGSLEEQLFALAPALRASGIALTIVFASAPPPWMRAALDGVDLRWLDFRRRTPLVTLTLWRWLRAARPSLVHFHFVRAHSPLVVAARLAGARVLVHEHMALGVAFVDVPARSSLAAAAARRWKRVRTTLLTRRCVDRRVAVSRFVADSVRAVEFVPAARLAVVEHGIEVERFAAASAATLRAELGAGERPIVGCVARLAPEKGVDVLLRAFARLDRDALLVVVGDGRDAARCRALAEELRLGERVRFLGLRRDVEAVLAACDLVVVPSLAPEAFGLSVVEAMAAGRPVVVSDAGAMPELVDHGRCGTVVPPGDATALRDAIARLLDGPVFAAELGRAGRVRARERYSLRHWLDRTLALYAEVAPSLPLEPPRPLQPPAPIEEVAVA